MNELPAPPDAAQDPEASEVLRAWVVDQALHCSLRPDTFTDAGTWGVLLAELVRHVAQGLQEEEGKDPAETIRLIRDQFEAELDAPDEEHGEEPGET